MNKFVFAAATALLLATTSAQAGSGVTFQIDGQRVRIESPRGCNSISCIQITAPGYKGKLGNIDFGSLGPRDRADEDDGSPPAKTTTKTAPVAAAPVAPVAAAPAPAPAPVAAAPAAAPVAAAPAPVVTNDITPA